MERIWDVHIMGFPIHTRMGGRCVSSLTLWKIKKVTHCLAHYFPPMTTAWLPSGYVKIAVENGHRHSERSHHKIVISHSDVSLLPEGNHCSACQRLYSTERATRSHCSFNKQPQRIGTCLRRWGRCAKLELVKDTHMSIRFPYFPQRNYKPD